MLNLIGEGVAKGAKKALQETAEEVGEKAAAKVAKKAAVGADDVVRGASKLTSLLSPEQEKYFAESMVRDKSGNLLPMYHGSNSDFSVFDLSRSGQSNPMAQVGFWFTPNKQGAKRFAERTWYGDNPEAKVYQTYLNLKNPKVYDKADNIKAVNELEKQAAILRGEQDKLQDDMIEAFKSGGVNSDDYIKRRAVYTSYLKKIREIEDKIQNLSYDDPYEMFRSDVYAMEGKSPYDANVAGLGSGLENSIDTTKRFVEKLKNEGHDGIIIRGTRYDSDTIGKNNDQYVVFDPEQIKDINNRNPTKDPNIYRALALLLGGGAMLGYNNKKKEG